MNFYTIESTISYSEEKLEQVVQSLNCVSGEDATPPQDAYVEFTDEGVNLVPEQYGTQVDASKLLPLVQTALEAGNTRVTIDSGCYVAPSVTTESEEIRCHYGACGKDPGDNDYIYHWRQPGGFGRQYNQKLDLPG